MEDALVLDYHLLVLVAIGVLILVLMEDALVRWGHTCFVYWADCLNPCFNGRCTSTLFLNGTMETYDLVLILVLMEDALVL